MRRAFLIIFSIFIAVMMTGQTVLAGGCGGVRGDCYAPGQPDTGYIGTETYPWGYGYFNTISTGTGTISATEIADITIGEDIPLAALLINGGAVVGADGTTAPGLATTDGIPKLIYASSGETSSIGYSFVLPPNYDSGLSFRMLVSSSSATSPDLLAFSWLAYVNKDGVAFDAAAYQQTKVNAVTACNTTNEVLDFTLGATAEADLEAGDIVTVWFWPADTRTGTVTTEIGVLQKRYVATQ